MLVVPVVLVLMALSDCVVGCVVVVVAFDVEPTIPSASASIFGGFGNASPEACRSNPGGRKSPERDLVRLPGALEV